MTQIQARWMSPSSLMMLMLAASIASHTQASSQDHQLMGVMEQKTVLAFYLNGVDQKTDVFMLVKAQQPYLECQMLEHAFIDISQLQNFEQDGNLYCLIQHAEIKYEIQEQQQQINLNVPANLLKKQQKSDIQQLSPEFPKLGGFINYSAYTEDGDFGRQTSASTDVNIFWNNMLFNSSHLFRKDHHDQDKIESSRLNTSLSFEFPNKLSTLTLGDNVSYPNGLNQSFYFGGLSYGTNFMHQPNYIYWNTPSISGSALTASNVDLIINGAQVYHQKVNPGQFQIDSHLNLTGLGDAQVIVTDILGNSTVKNMSFFVSQRLLRPGLNDYNISVGKLRFNYAYDDNDYRDWFASAYLRRGITPHTTLGTTLDYSEQLQSTGFMWSQYVQQMGLLELNAAYSRVKDLDLKGYTINSEFRRDQPNYSLGLRTQYYSPDFRTLGLNDYAYSYFPENEHQIYFTKNNIPYFNHVSLSYIERQYRDQLNRRDQKLFNLRTSKSLTPKLFGSLGLSYDTQNNHDLSMNLMLTYRFDHPRYSMQLNHSNDDQTYLQLNHHTDQNTGLDYKIGVGRSHAVNSGDLSATWKTNQGDLNLQYLQSDHQQYYRAHYSGALVWLDRRIDLAKYIDHSFALVRLDQNPNVDIYSNGSYIGKTNQKGEIFTYNLYGYAQNYIGFDERQLDVNAPVGDSAKSIITMSKRGYVVDFPMLNNSEQTHQVTLKFIDENQHALPTGALVNILGVEGAKYPINSDQYVQISGLKPQRYNIEVKLGDQYCYSQLDLAQQETDSPIILMCQ